MNTEKSQPNHSRKEYTSVALEAFFNVCKLWNLNTTQEKKLLGLDSNSSSYFNYKKKLSGILSNDMLDRISYILGIFKSLQILFTDKTQAYSWIKKENKTFNNKSALDVMLQGQIVDLARVREYLDAQRGY